MQKPDQLFKAFSDKTRLRLLNLLAQRPHCVCEFQSILRVPQPTISRHLAYLRRCDLVEEERHGRPDFPAAADARQSQPGAEKLTKVTTISSRLMWPVSLNSCRI
jgi:DNA-binding transcriptional ArsR family regulator